MASYPDLDEGRRDPAVRDRAARSCPAGDERQPE
jgi:hypothetical protein